jgi:hypothetical protein
MPRARNIKHAFFTNDELAELTVSARLLFIGLWTLADREGKLIDKPKRIKAQLFPYDNFSVDSLLSDLHEAGFIVRYVVCNESYIQVTNFNKHQNPHKNEQESEIPDIPQPIEKQEEIEEVNPLVIESRNAPIESEKIECARADSLLLIPDRGKMIVEMINYWNEEVQRTLTGKTVILNTDRKKQLGLRLKSELQGDINNWNTLCQDIKASDFLMGKTDNKWKITIDWILKPANIVKVLEGNYKNKEFTKNEVNNYSKTLEQLKQEALQWK